MKVTEVETAIKIVVFLALFTTAGIFTTKSLPWLALIPGIAAFAYWNMIHDKTRIEMYRYADWFLTTPLMLLVILRQNNVTDPYIQIVLFLNVLMITSGYYATQPYEKSTKAMWFFLGAVLFIPIAYVLYSLPIEKQAALFMLATWSVYPFIWIFRETQYLKRDYANIAYALMDAVSKIGLLSLLHI